MLMVYTHMRKGNITYKYAEYRRGYYYFHSLLLQIISTFFHISISGSLFLNIIYFQQTAHSHILAFIFFYVFCEKALSLIALWINYIAKRSSFYHYAG